MQDIGIFDVAWDDLFVFFYVRNEQEQKWVVSVSKDTLSSYLKDNDLLSGIVVYPNESGEPVEETFEVSIDTFLSDFQTSLDKPTAETLVNFLISTKYVR